MPAVQGALALTLPSPSRRPRLRNVRRPFHPSPAQGPYRLPHDVRDGLVRALQGYRNRDEALTLAAFLGRFWSAPNRLLEAFAIDRRALVDHPELGLTEARVRGALKTLEEIGFLERSIPPSSKYQRTPDGWQCRPIYFVFGSTYLAGFRRANERAQAARRRNIGKRHNVSEKITSPIYKAPAISRVNMGELVQSPRPAPEPVEVSPALEAALSRFRGAWESRQ